MLRSALFVLAIVAAGVGAVEDSDPFIDIPFKRIKTSVSNTLFLFQGISLF